MPLRGRRERRRRGRCIASRGKVYTKSAAKVLKIFETKGRRCYFFCLTAPDTPFFNSLYDIRVFLTRGREGEWPSDAGLEGDGEDGGNLVGVLLGQRDGEAFG